MTRDIKDIRRDAELFEQRINQAVVNAQLAVEGHPTISQVSVHDWGFTYLYSHPAMIMHCAVLYAEGGRVWDIMDIDPEQLPPVQNAAWRLAGSLEGLIEDVIEAAVGQG